MNASVVVPTFNDDTLSITLDALAAQEVPPDLELPGEEGSLVEEVIIVNDGGVDPATTVSPDSYDITVRVLHHEQSRGPAAARNTGWRAANSEYIAFTDADCRPPTEWVANLLHAFAVTSDDCGGVGGPLVPQPEDNSLGALIEKWRMAIYGPWDSIDVGDHDEIDMAGTANVCYRRDALRSVGGFDEEYPVPGGEDADLARRVNAAGYQLVSIPIEVEHHTERSIEGFITRSWQRGVGVAVTEERPFWRIFVGLVATPVVGFHAGLTRRDGRLAVAVTLDRAIQRIGELAGRLGNSK